MADGQTSRQADRQKADRRTDGQTSRQTDIAEKRKRDKERKTKRQRQRESEREEKRERRLNKEIVSLAGSCYLAWAGRSCSTSLSSGNQVDGLPLVVHNNEAVKPAPAGPSDYG